MSKLEVETALQKVSVPSGSSLKLILHNRECDTCFSQEGDSKRIFLIASHGSRPPDRLRAEIRKQVLKTKEAKGSCVLWLLDNKGCSVPFYSSVTQGW